MGQSHLQRPVAALVLTAALAGCAAEVTPHSKAHPPATDGWQVSRVIDGDTIEVTRDSQTLTLRLIGIDTPETVHPSKPVECYGPEASAFALKALLDHRVNLEFDPSQGHTDYFGRTLAYVWVEREGKPYLFNERAIRAGIASEYTYDKPYRWHTRFIEAQKAARDEQRGLWGACN
jgi:micrococcal nuclease